MPLLRFDVLKTEEDSQVDGIDYPILLNTDHITSIKPIKIMYQGNIINGHWIRTVSEKKYRATRIPNQLKAELLDDSNLTQKSINQEIDQTDQVEILEHQ